MYFTYQGELIKLQEKADGFAVWSNRINEFSINRERCQ
jgi:hypothetical protein